MPGDDGVPQFEQFAPQLVTLRLEVRRRDSQKDGLWIRGSLLTRVGVAQVLEDLGDIVGNVIDPLVEALQRGAAKRLVEFPQPARERIALKKLVGHQAAVQRAQ